MDITEKNLKKLEKLFSLMDSDTLTKEDFLKSFENVVSLVLKIEKRNSEAVELLEKTYSRLSEKVRDDYISSLSDFKKEFSKFVNTQIEKITESVDKKMKMVRDGKDADETQIIKNVISQIKLPEQKEIILDNAGQIRDKLEILKGEDRLDKSAIRGLDDLLKSGYMIEKPIFSFGGRRGSVLRAVDLSSQCDGIIKAFTLPIDVRKVFGLFGTQFPVQFAPTGDWSVSGRTLTLGDSVGAPAIGQTLWALCEVL